MDDPDMILELIHYHPDFKAMYNHLYDMCGNIERVMNMFSKELQELDRNTVQLMIDEMQDTIDSQKSALSSKEHIIISQKDTIDSQKKLILELQKKLGISEE